MEEFNLVFKQWTKLVAALFVLVALLGACGSNDEQEDATINNSTESSETGSANETEEQSDEIEIIISKNDGEETLDQKTVSIEDDAILMDIMEEHFDLETEFDGAFVVTINGVGPEEDEELAWMYSVNGKQPNVGADEYEVEFGDEVVFDLQPW